MAFTLDTYSHVLPGLQQAAADRLDRLMTGVPAGDPSAENYAIEQSV